MKLRDIKKERIQGISVLDLTLSKLYVYKKEIKIFGFLLRKAGIYNRFHNEYVDIVNMDDIILFNGDVYIKPRCIILLDDRKFHTVYFDSYKDAKEFADSNCDKKCIKKAV